MFSSVARAFVAVPLTDDDVRDVIVRALADERGYDNDVKLVGDAEDHLVRLAGGDARRALTYLEAAVGAALAARGLSGADLDFVVPHQAGSGIVRFTGMQLDGLGVRCEVVNGLVRDIGNTFLAELLAIPTHLADAL